MVGVVAASLILSGAGAGVAFGQDTTGEPARGQPSEHSGGSQAVTPPTSDQEMIAKLKKELEQARAEIAALKARIAELEGTENGAGDGVVRSVLPIDPLSCPPSMLVELKRRHERVLGAFPVATPSQRERLMEEAEKWCRDVARELRGKRVWLARIENVGASTGAGREAFAATLTALDETTHRPLGEPVRIGLAARFAERIRAVERERRVGDAEIDPATRGAWAWEVTAIVSAAPVFDAERTEIGVFNSPAFVGRYVAFGIDLEVVGLTDIDLPPEKKVEEKPVKTPSLDPGR